MNIKKNLTGVVYDSQDPYYIYAEDANYFRKAQQVANIIEGEDSVLTLPAKTKNSHFFKSGGRLYLFGGNGAGADTDTIWIADESDPTNWSANANTLPWAVSGGHIFSDGINVYIAGGESGGTTLDKIMSASLSDLTTWSDTGQVLPAPRSFGVVIETATDFFIYGGEAFGSDVDTIFTAFVSAPDTWSDTGSVLPATRTRFSGFVLGQTIYFFGGMSAGSMTIPYMYALLKDPTVVVNSGVTIAYGVLLPVISCVGDKVFLVGGFDDFGGANRVAMADVSYPLKMVDCDTVLPSYYSDCVGYTDRERIYLFGGFDGGNERDEIFYLPIRDIGVLSAQDAYDHFAL